MRIDRLWHARDLSSAHNVAQQVPVGAQPQKALGKSAPLLQHRRKASAPRPLTPVAASTQEGSNPSTEAPQRRGPVGSLIDMSQPGLSRRQVLQAAGAAATAVACPCCPTGPAMAAADWDYGERKAQGFELDACPVATPLTHTHLAIMS
eukprot:931508-Pelagomonas_calceolata.AAC.2